MTLAEQFSESVVPDTWTIMGVRLQPFSVSHLLTLQRLGSPFVCGGNESPADLLAALYVCSRRSIAQSLSRPGLLWRLKAWRAIFLTFVRPDVFVTRCKMFRDYIEESCKAPKHWLPPSDSSIEITSPFALILFRIGLASGYTREEALNAPIRELRFLQVSINEEKSQGKVRFVTDEERSMAQ